MAETGVKVMLSNVRVRFPNVHEPKAMEGSKPRYSASLLLDPKADAAQIAKLKEAIKAAAKSKWAAKADTTLKALEAADKTCLHNGDAKADYDGFAGNLYVSASAQATSAPSVLDRDKSPLSPTSGKPYDGCYVNASISIWAQDNQYGKRVNATLRGIQFAKDGEPFSGSRPASADEFEELSDDGSDLV